MADPSKRGAGNAGEGCADGNLGVVGGFERVEGLRGQYSALDGGVVQGRNGLGKREQVMRYPEGRAAQGRRGQRPAHS